MDRDLCIHMALDKSVTSYPSQISTQSQGSINDSVTKAEPINSMDSDMPNLINVPKEVLFQDYLFPPWL